MNPYDPVELGRRDPELDRVAYELERQAAAMGGDPPLDLTARILSAIEDEPIPGSRWAWLTGLQGPGRLLAAAAVLVVAVTGGLAIASLIEQAGPDVGGPPTPIVVPSASATPSASPSPTSSPSPSPSSSPTLSPTPSPSVRPTPGDDDEVETPEPSESDDDSSGPGSGDDDDRSGPGGGDDGDSSGPGGG